MRDIVGCGSTLHIACTAIFSVVKFFCTQKYNADEVIVLCLLIFMLCLLIWFFFCGWQAKILERDGINLIQSGWTRHKTADQMIVDASDQIEEADALVENANKVKDLADAHTNEALVEKMQDISEEFKTAAEVFWPRFLALFC